MSIETQLEELNQIKTNIFTSIRNKGIIVPENSGLKDAAGLIDQIEGGGGETTVIIDGIEYNLVKIGNRIWTASDLASPNIGVWYDNDSSLSDYGYGKLYSYSDVSNIQIPSGFRLPTLQDYQDLINSVNGESTKLCKSSGEWVYGDGTNESGFSAMPGGRYTIGTFDSLGNYGFYMMSTFDGEYIYALEINPSVYEFNTHRVADKFSIRLCKDA